MSYDSDESIMELHTTQSCVSIGEGGNIRLPDEIYALLGAKSGDELILRWDGDELRLFKQQDALAKLQKFAQDTLSSNSTCSSHDFINHRALDNGE